MGQHFEKAKKRIKDIYWHYKDDYRPSHAVLVVEFIRRGNVFLDYCKKDCNRRVAIFSAAQVIGADLPIDMKEVCKELNVIGGGTALVICSFYLERAYLVDQEVPEAMQFQDLYEPIIKLFERGGRVFYRHNELVCGGYGWTRNSALILRDSPPFDIGDKALIEEDNKWYRRSISNQAEKYIESNHLWKQSIDELADAIMKQLEPYNHSTSKEIVIAIELAERLFDHEATAEQIADIKENLERCQRDSLVYVQPEDEKKVVSVRLEELLRRLRKLE
jgi:hypothetical protein